MPGEQQEQEQQQHPIESLMKTAMETIKQMVDVNTVVGDPVETPDGTVIMPVSRVSCGFGAGGGEFGPAEKIKSEEGQTPYFGGGSGAGVSVQPVGFLVVGHGQIRFLPVDNNIIIDRLIDLAPQVLEKIESLWKKDNRQQQRQFAPASPAAGAPPQAPPA
ncbi:MAG: GerW family sporulation protein [Armatimonadetes bacterium]|nr:GerW family sporulation protein [Armatimonadota bacterium]